MKSFWEFYQIVENETKDYYVGKLNITCFHNKLKEYFKEIFYEKLEKQTSIEDIETIERYILKLDNILDLKNISFPEAKNILDKLVSAAFKYIDQNTEELHKLTLITNPNYFEKQVYQVHLQYHIDHKTPDTLIATKEDVIDLIMSYIRYTGRYSNQLYGFISDCTINDHSVDWRPNETVPEDYY